MRRFYGCKLADDIQRRMSSSGGAFTAFAMQVLAEGGVVFGAAFSQDFRSVHHIAVENLEDLKKLRGSKYLPSHLGETFASVKRHLETNRPVLFSGTPCQVGALHKYLGDTSHDKLYCIDLVCHGVPDNKVYQHYLDQLEQEHKSKVCFINFRDKTKGWHQAEFVIHFANGDELRERVTDNAFMRGFIGNLYLRPSCTHCQFKKFTSGSDLTLSDFWGATELGAYNDDIGISVVAIHTPQGQQLFERACTYLKDIKEVDERTAYTFNESAYQNSPMHPQRDDFYNRYPTEGFEALVSELYPNFTASNTASTSFSVKLKQLIRRVHSRH